MLILRKTKKRVVFFFAFAFVFSFWFLLGRCGRWEYKWDMLGKVDLKTQEKV